MVKTVVGLFFGLLVAWTVSDRLVEFLYQVNPANLVTYVSVTLSLLVITVAASYFPARQATRIHPMEALRSE